MFTGEFQSRNILSRQQWKILDNAKKRGVDMTAREALEIARNQQRNSGRVENKTLYLTDAGKNYSNLTSEERAITRRARETGRPVDHYTYIDGRALLRPEFRKIK